MGAWGTGIFENDDAADFLFELDEGGAERVNEAFQAVLKAAKAGYIEAPDASIALAAGEAVAFALGEPWSELTPEQDAVFEKHKGDVTALPAIRDAAISAIDLVVGDAETSELLALWSEDGADDDTAEFLASVADLRRRVDG